MKPRGNQVNLGLFIAHIGYVYVYVAEAINYGYSEEYEAKKRDHHAMLQATNK